MAAPTRETDAAAVIRRWHAARDRRRPWEGLWREAWDVALPQRGPAGSGAGAGPAPAGRADLYDGTAPDAVEQLAASLLARLTPPWSRWFALAAGPDLASDERDRAAPVLERIGERLHAAFERSNLSVELHQCFLDLVTAGTACLQFEEAPVGAPGAFRFTAVPLSELALEEGPAGCLDVVFRESAPDRAALRRRFPGAALPPPAGDAPEDERFTLVEAVRPDGDGYRYEAVLDHERGPVALAAGRFARSPFIAFRWLKAPGEAYGRSPVMTALPDIRTANKVVELILRNASIAVTGIWQADDDGVLNPATVRLVPGTIIPKAVGSQGLRPLEAPGRFDVSQLVLEDLRGRIRHALLADRLGQVDSPAMTATEVLERSAEMARLLGATYGRLQSELLDPLVARGLAILRRQGQAPDLVIDGRTVEIRYRSPLARDQGREEARNVMLWLEAVGALGAEGAAAVDGDAAARWLARALGVPAELVRPADAMRAPAPAVPTAAAGPALPDTALAALAGALDG